MGEVHMIGFIRRLLKDARGNMIVIAGAALPLVVGSAGLATDTIQWTLWKRELQRAADSAAIAGVYDREQQAGATSTTDAAVAHDLTLNLHTGFGLKATYPKVSFPAGSGSMTNQVRVELAAQRSLPFSSLFMSAAPTITANATAASVPGAGDPCVNARESNPTKSGIIITGNAAIYMPDCDFHSNSPAKDSAVAKGSAVVDANSVSAVGGVQESDNWNVNAYRPYSPPVADPFASVNPLPSDMKCAVQAQTTTKQGVTTTTYTPLPLTEDTVFTGPDAPKDVNGDPANCFSEMSVGSNKSLTIPADFGPVYVNGGNAFIQGDLTCTGCSIVLTNKDTTSNTIGDFKVNADSKINMSAPTSGTFKGIAIYQDRRATDGSSKVNKINGNSDSIITGALYFPNQELQYNGGGTTAATCTMFVARRVNFTGNSTTSNKFKSLRECEAAGLPQNVAARMVRLVA
jgi:hypothetical protein